jgi:lysozyme
MRHVNEATLNLIKEFETLRLKAYKCQAGIWTIGWGHTGGVKEGDMITKAQADQLLENDLSVSEQDVERIIQMPLTDNQFGALVSFDFNIGGKKLNESTLHKRLDSGDYDGVPEEMMRWHHVNGKDSDGLKRRRAAEIELWNKQTEMDK